MLPKMQRTLFDKLGGATREIDTPGDGALQGLLRRAAAEDHPADDWVGEADWARLEQEPLRARGLLRVVAFTLFALLVWAAIAEVDEVTRGQGRVIPSSQLQVVQSVDGGVVEELAVREGQTVEAGDLLLRIDPTRFVSNLLESRATAQALQAKAARLEALTRGVPFAVSAELERDIPAIVAHERRLFETSRESIDAQIAIARQQVGQRQQELAEARARREQAARGLELAQRELEVTRPLVQSGAVSDVDILRLERDVARMRGERDQAAAQIARVQAAISEAEGKVQEVELAVRNQWRAELSETMSKLGSLGESARGLEDRVKHAEIRSPVRGTVKRLLVNTVGGVVQPGKEVVEIVPLDDALILEAKVSPRDIGFLRPGQPATVKFSAYDFAIYGGLDAVVEQISADSLVDEEGETFYLVRVRTLERSLGEGLPTIPGMLADVDVLTGKKSVLSYLVKPVLRARDSALTER